VLKNLSWKNVLIVGARRGSLGFHVAENLRSVSKSESSTVSSALSTFTAGLSGEEIFFDALWTRESIIDTLDDLDITDVVCTVGVNMEHEITNFDADRLVEETRVNAVAPMNLLSAWIDHITDRPLTSIGELMPGNAHHFAIISSNSAQIARSKSLGYCMSKAAVSMGVRVAARTAASLSQPLAVYAYEPGWLEGTPMSDNVSRRIAHSVPKGAPPHRIPGGNGIDTRHLAGMITSNLFAGQELNGTTLRIDGGEQ